MAEFELSYTAAEIDERLSAVDKKAEAVEISYEEYNNLSEEEKNNGTMYLIPDAVEVGTDMVIDETPTEGSTNLVASGGVYNEIAELNNNKVNISNSWGFLLENVPSEGTGLTGAAIKYYDGTTMGLENVNSYGAYRVDLITKTGTADSCSSYLVFLHSDGVVINEIYKGTTTKTPILYESSSASNLRCKLVGDAEKLHVYVSITRLG